jgi:hypothetical protein
MAETEARYALTTDPAEITGLRADTMVHYDDAEMWLLVSRVLVGVASGLVGWSTYSFLSDPYADVEVAVPAK